MVQQWSHDGGDGSGGGEGDETRRDETLFDIRMNDGGEESITRLQQPASLNRTDTGHSGCITSPVHMTSIVYNHRGYVCINTQKSRVFPATRTYN